jgi:hypothetical protein
VVHVSHDKVGDLADNKQESRNISIPKFSINRLTRMDYIGGKIGVPR